MSAARDAPRWRVLLAPRWLAWHAFCVAAVTGMAWLGYWQLSRAEAGNALSWAYTFEWPVFAVFGLVFWVRTIRDELKPAARPSGQRSGVDLPAGVTAGPAPGQGGADDDEPDPELDSYNAYLARLSNEVRGHGRWHGFR
jgi:hypothetical protein